MTINSIRKLIFSAIISCNTIAVIAQDSSQMQNTSAGSTKNTNSQMRNGSMQNSGMQNNAMQMQNGSGMQMSSDTSMMNMPRPFTGTKNFRKFSVGLNAGVLAPIAVTGGSNSFTRWKADFGFGANVRYQFTHYFAIQVDAISGTLHGNQDKHWGNGQVPNDPVRSFKTTMKVAASISGQFTFGNINWLWTKNKIVPYVGAGAGLANYEAKIVKAGSSAEVDYPHRGNGINEYFIVASAGLKVDITSFLDLDLGYRAHYMDYDNFDGYVSRPGHKDKFSYGFIGLNFSIGKKSNQRLLFNNPAAVMNMDMNSKYNNLLSMMNNNKDADGDGVADIFDKEPNTPAGCPVDTHGVTRDTDGDGVPDCRDKQLITPTECQPVDADGVGKCPPPACCTDVANAKSNTDNSTCTLSDLPSISFKGSKNVLTADAKSMLATIASKLKASPTCSITITGYSASSKAAQAICNRRVAWIQSYLTENEGVSADRISVECQVGQGDANTVDIKAK